MSEKPWNGRFSDKTDQDVESFTASIDVDRRLYRYDIAGSVAHCRMLAKTEIITEEEASTLIEGLSKIEKEIERGKFEFDAGLEDIHMHIESRLVEQTGKTALKIHTARSRNDQIALDVRMYLKDEVKTIIDCLLSLRKVMTDLAKTHLNVIMPGYTHLQRAQPVLLSHHWMAYYEMFSRDAQRFREGLERIDVMPLGSAALAGTTYPIDREFTAQTLGFAEVSQNSIDSVSDRDFIIEFLSSASLCMVHLSRLSEELILWSSSEFDFIRLPDAFATGSSIMPQKKNPDVAELVRGKSGRVFGSLIALLTLMKALPLAYNRDMQEDKAPLFDAVDTLKGSLKIYIRMLPRLKVNAESMKRAAGCGFLNATDLADYLVTRGMPFREAHACVGSAVSYALSKGKELNELTLKELKGFSSLIAEDAFDMLTLEQMIDRRSAIGGTATKTVKAAIKRAEKTFKKEMGSSNEEPY
jgi:argininosuccinate lyase